MTEWSRRTFLGVAAAGVLTGCGAAPTTGTSASASPSGSPAERTLSAKPGRIPWKQLARATTGALVLPSSPRYNSLRKTPNPRYDSARPLALLEVADAKDVAAALRFASGHGVPIALRSGGHSYPGWSSGGRPRALVVDCRRLNTVTWSGTSATIGPGARLGDVYPAVAGRGRAIPGGSCPTVGIGGLTLGGGVGVITRAYGLTCDRLTSARVVLPSGRIVTASATSEPDLFWALRGGGGGHIGVVTALTFDTFTAPALTTTYLTWPASAAKRVIPAWFDWMAGAAPQLWSTLKLLGGAAHPNGPSLAATVTWVGRPSRFDPALAPILQTSPSGRYDHSYSYLGAMQAYGGSGAREAFAATSDIAYAPPSASAISALAHRIATTPGSIHEGGISIDALGGRVADHAPEDTAFVHRRARATVQYTATYDSGTATPASSFVHGLRTTMNPTWGNHAYVNYADASLPNFGAAYFGANWARLQQVRAHYDPHGLFTQPQ